MKGIGQFSVLKNVIIFIYSNIYSHHLSIHLEKCLKQTKEKKKQIEK